MSPSDREGLSQALKAGDLSEFKKLFESYSPLVLGIAMRMLRNREDAEDVTQDVFLQAYRSLNHFRGDSQLSTWLYRIAVNVSLNLQRKGKHRKLFALFKKTEDVDPPGEPGNFDIPGFAEGTPAWELERGDTAKIVQEAIDSLPDQQRVAIMLYHYEGLTYSEISEVMEVSVASVESRLHRAKMALAKKLLKLRGEL